MRQTRWCELGDGNGTRAQTRTFKIYFGIKTTVAVKGSETSTVALFFDYKIANVTV